MTLALKSWVVQQDKNDVVLQIAKILEDSKEILTAKDITENKENELDSMLQKDKDIDKDFDKPITETKEQTDEKKNKFEGR